MTLLKAGGLGENSMIAKQSQTLMGFAQNTTFKVHLILLPRKLPFLWFSSMPKEHQ